MIASYIKNCQPPTELSRAGTYEEVKNNDEMNGPDRNPSSRHVYLRFVTPDKSLA